jgi:hypothetical protein
MLAKLEVGSKEEISGNIPVSAGLFNFGTNYVYTH